MSCRWKIQSGRTAVWPQERVRCGQLSARRSRDRGRIETNGVLLHQEPLTHSYSHCWRHKSPLIFGATPQWFISMDQTDCAMRCVRSIGRWTPEWGQSRITTMIENRPDWCISRQRTWGASWPFRAQAERRSSSGYHTVDGKVAEQWRSRASKLGRLDPSNCSARIRPSMKNARTSWMYGSTRVSHECVLGVRLNSRFLRISARRLGRVLRLVPDVAVDVRGNLRHGIVSRCAHARLYRRWTGTQDVQVVRQCDCAAGRHEDTGGNICACGSQRPTIGRMIRSATLKRLTDSYRRMRHDALPARGTSDSNPSRRWPLSEAGGDRPPGRRAHARVASGDP